MVGVREMGQMREDAVASGTHQGGKGGKVGLPEEELLETMRNGAKPSPGEKNDDQGALPSNPPP